MVATWVVTCWILATASGPSLADLFQPHAGKKPHDVGLAVLAPAELAAQRLRITILLQEELDAIPQVGSLTRIPVAADVGDDAVAEAAAAQGVPWVLVARLAPRQDDEHPGVQLTLLTELGRVLGRQAWTPTARTAASPPSETHGADSDAAESFQVQALYPSPARAGVSLTGPVAAVRGDGKALNYGDLAELTEDSELREQLQRAHTWATLTTRVLWAIPVVALIGVAGALLVPVLIAALSFAGGFAVGTACAITSGTPGTWLLLGLFVGIYAVALVATWLGPVTCSLGGLGTVLAVSASVGTYLGLSWLAPTVPPDVLLQAWAQTWPRNCH